MAEKVIRVADLPGMRAFFDAVGALLDAVNAEQVPPAVVSAADRVRAEALGIGNDGPQITIAEDERTPQQLADEERIRTAMTVAKQNPGRAVHVDWTGEPRLEDGQED